MRASQIVRASWPWLVYHRKPINDMLKPFFLSKAQGFYHRFSQEYALERPRELYRSGAHRMVMLEGAQPWNKGNEPFRSSWRTAERMFCLVGLAHRKRPRVLGPSYFGTRENDQGMVAFAQGMFYNANRESFRGGTQQSLLAWDTLNWHPDSSDVPEYQATSMPDWGFSGSQCPRVLVNWLAVMVPVGRVDEMAGGAAAPPPAPYGPVVDRMVLPIPGAMRNH